MKRKYIILGICTAVILAGIGVFASGLGADLIGQLPGNSEQVSQPIINEAALKRQAEDQQRREAAEQALVSANAGQAEQQLTKFDQMRLVMDATIEDPMEYNNNLFNYVYLQDVYQLTQDQMDYIADLVIDGCDMTSIIEISYFGLDTNEDISLIEQIYNHKNDFGKADTWIENAFNLVTNNKCGVLGEEDIEEYNHQGITTAEILVANRLCRKGVMTIQEILQERINGKSFAQISAQINGENVPMLMSEGEESNADDPEDIITSQRLEALTGVDNNTYLAQAAQGEDIKALFREKNEEKNSVILSWLWRDNLCKPVPDDEPQEGDEF